MKTLKITAAGAVTIEEIATLEELQAAVGGYIEIVALSPRNDLVLNEEGKIYNLPYNHIASVLTVVLNVGLEVGDVVVGDVLVTGAPDPADEEGNRTDFDPAILETIAGLGFPTP